MLINIDKIIDQFWLSDIIIASTDFKHSTNVVTTADGESLPLRRIQSVKVSKVTEYIYF